MRCVQDGRFGYIFNGWADGKTVFRNESQSGLSFNAMKEAAKRDSAIRARVDHFLLRTPEELYDFTVDPNALRNLAAERAYRKQLEQFRGELLRWMESTADPLAGQFRSRLREAQKL